MYSNELNHYPSRWPMGSKLLGLFEPQKNAYLAIRLFSTQKTFLVFWLSSQAALALAWMALLYNHRQFSAVVLLATFLGITAFNLGYILFKNFPSSFLKLQSGLIIMTIVGLHIALGGLAESSFVLLVSVLPIIGLQLQRELTSYRLLAILFPVIGLVIIDPIWSGPSTATFELSYFAPFLSINLIAFLGLPLSLLAIYLKSEEKTKYELELKEEQLAVEYEEIATKSALVEKSLSRQHQALRYASRIQTALYPAKEELFNFFSDSFILNHPKDFVSGDFYWCSNQVDRYILVLGDCTGHGVSGGFLTILGSSILNQLVNETGISAPGILLRSLDMRLSAYLHQGNSECDNRVSDGMDLAVLVFDKASSTLQFAGAKQGLWVLSNQEWQYIKGDRIPIGHSERYKSKRWITHTIPYQKGDRFYLTTDGYRDQFGGENNMKFGRLRMESLLHAHEGSTLDTTEAVLEDHFQTWKGDHAQTDDVLVMGLEV